MRMSFKYGTAVAIIGLVGLGGPASAAARSQAASQSAVTVDDSTLESRIHAALKRDAELKGHDIDVDVSGGVVALKGTVRTDAEKARAEKLATIAGVTSVRNDLVVDPAAKIGSRADRAAEKTKAGTNKAIDATKDAGEKTADKTKEVAGKTADKSKDVGKKTAETSKGAAKATKDAAKDVGEKTKDAAATTGEAFSDGWITTKIKTKFIDEDLLKGSDINVDTNDHVVTLKGTVKSAAGKERAAEIARTTDGVKRIVNELVVQ
jgi:hyperosmotically inducible protein